MTDLTGSPNPTFRPPMPAALPIQGIFTPNVVPLDERGRINEGELRRYTSWLIDRGVHGLYPNGSTGEFTRFTPEERRTIVRIMLEEAAGRVPVLAGAAEANVAETISACEYYHSLGARAVAIVAPFYYKVGPEGVYAYFKQIADASPIDVTLYNIPMFASPIDVPTVRRLAEECTRVAAIKDSSGDLPHMMRMIAAVRPVRPDFAFLTGWDAAIVPMLLMGCDGGTNALSGVVPEATRTLFDLTKAGHIDEARELQYQLLPLFDALLYEADFPAGFRAALSLRGFHAGESRHPALGAERIDLSAVDARIQQVLAAVGAESGDATDDQSEYVSNIVHGVIEELRRSGAL